MRIATVFAAALLVIDLAASQTPTARTFRPADLFRVTRVGAIAWSPGAQYATIELTRPAPLLDTIPNNDLALLDLKARTLRPLSPSSASYLGFFNALWSPDGQRLAFLSVDAEAVVRLWIWTAGAASPVEQRGIDVRTRPGDPPMAWIDGTRLAIVEWVDGAEKSGPLYFGILRGRNVADRWKVAADGRESTASILESGRAPATAVANTQIITLDVSTGARRTLARGRLHRLSVSPDGCCVSFLRQNPGLPGQPVASYFERAATAGNVDAAYTAVNWGTDRQTVDARSGAEIASPPAPATRPAAKVDVPLDPPSPGARQVSVAPAGDAAIYLSQGADGSRLWISGGGGRPLSSAAEIWRGNDWMRDITFGRAESFAYTGTDGQPLTAWLLLPPNHAAGARAPVVTIVYPTTVYGQSTPSSLSPFQAGFTHPQLYAALGYAVLLPSMPASKDPLDSHAIELLLSQVTPAVDAAIARGVADPDRIAIVGQSDGGFTVLGVIAQTNRFRSAVASASFSNLVSMYGTLRGDSRHGDTFAPEPGQVLRMLQFEKGLMGLAGPPWIERQRYDANSPLLRADKIQTPLMLVHGELDDIPIQQAEELFTALHRQDKRAVLVRYAGEGHTISARANVLDLWTRLEAWLAETMAPRK
jgi:dipeptidyl aminopeptidase/acylaminoacyl peptidase